MKGTRMRMKGTRVRMRGRLVGCEQHLQLHIANIVRMRGNVSAWPRRAEQSHEVGDYGLLQRAVTRVMKRKKKPKSALNDCAAHCQSLDHLQRLHSEKDAEIRRHIQEKAEYQAHNEELKHLASNPTAREHALHLRIAALEEDNRALKDTLERQQQAHRQEIERIRDQHKAEIEAANRQKTTEHYRTQPEQNRTQTTEVRYQPYRSEAINRIETAKPHSYDARAYLHPQHTLPQTTSAHTKPEASPRVVMSSSQAISSQAVNSQAVISSNAISQGAQQARTYISSGSPVHLAGRQEEAKGGMRAVSPDTSKNTTSHTRVYRGDSPQVVSYPSTRRPEESQSGVFGEQDLQAIYRKYCISD